MNTNVLLLTPYSFTNYGGVQNQVNLIEEYLDNHHQFNVKVFAHGKIDSLNKEKIYNIPFNSSISSVMLFPNNDLLEDSLNWADVIHIHEPFVPLIFWRLPKNKKYVFTHHASLNKFILFLLKSIYRLFSFNSISTHVSIEAKSNALALSKKSKLIPNMIKINKDAKFSKSDGYLFIGRQEKRKNFNFFNMLSKEDNFRENKFIAITNKRISTDNIEFFLKPTESEKYEIFQRTNIYLALNTKSESFGITLLEAVNNGNLAITSDLPAFKNVLINSHVVFENKSYSSLVSLLSSISGSNIEKLWNHQFSDLNNYDLDKNMEKFIYIYSKL